MNNDMCVSSGTRSALYGVSFICNLCTLLLSKYRPGSSLGIVTDYGLEGPGSNPGGDEIFRSSRPALGPTQPPIKWVPGLSWG